MVHVLVYSEDGERLVDQCEGANWSGGCPRSPPGRPVLCAGRKLIVLGANGVIRMVLAVEPDAVSCPLAALKPL